MDDRCGPKWRADGNCRDEIKNTRIYLLTPVSETYLLLIDSDPVSGGEPPVVLYVIDSVLQVSEPLRQVHLQQISEQILEVTAKLAGEPHLQQTQRSR